MVIGMVRSAMPYGMEAVVVARKRMEELKVLKSSLGRARMDKILNEIVRREAVLCK